MSIVRRTTLFILSLIIVSVTVALADDEMVPLGFVKRISIPTIQNNVTLDKEGNIYVSDSGISSGAYIYKTHLKL